MGRYVYIDKDSSKGRFGIGVGIFTVLANEALTRIPGLATDPVETRHRHKLILNKSDVSIHHGVVYVKVFVNALRSVNIEELRQQLIEEINSSFMMVAEQVPVEVKVNVENII